MKYCHIFAISLLLASCGNSGNSDKGSLETKSVEERLSFTDTTQNIAESPDKVDAVSGATNVAISPTFNGIIDVSPQDRATLTLTMGGIIRTLDILPGQKVRKGQLVATVENPEFIELQMNYLDTKSRLEFLEAEYLRQESLSRQNAVSQKDLQLSRSEYNSMKARMMSVQARLTTLGIDSKTLLENGISPYLKVSAPIGGYVANLDAHIGKYVDEDSPLCEIIDKSRPILVLTVYEKDLGHITVGENIAFKVNGMGDNTFKAVVTSVDQVVDPADYSIKVYAKVGDRHEEFRPGMYVRAKVREE